jgi:RND family efflux transporter MFP subunit
MRRCLTLAACCLLVPNVQAADEKEVAVSQPIEREVTDYEDFTGRTDAVQTVDLRARVSGYLNKVHFRDGAQVKKGELLFEIDARPYKAELEQSETEVKKAEATLKLATAQYERAKALRERGTISAEEFDKYTAELEAAKGTLHVARAVLALRQLNMDYTQVRAPIDGRISRRLVDPGNLVKADDTHLATIVVVDPIYAYFDIDERTLLRWRKGLKDAGLAEDKVPVSMGLANEKDFPRRGTLDYADVRVDPKTGTLRMRAVFENPSKEIVPGMFVRCRLAMGKPYKARLVADKLIQNNRSGESCLKVVDEKGRRQLRNVTIGTRFGELRVILEGLKTGDQVIVVDSLDVKEGDTVKPRRVAMPGADKLGKDEKPDD